MITETKDTKSFEWIRSFLYRNYGIFYEDDKLYKLKHKLNKRIRQLEINSLDEYVSYLRENSQEINDLLEVISTNKSLFYREEKHWKYMREILVPTWENSGKIKIWSAACSSGEEPYTVAMILEDLRTSGEASVRYDILATDISRKMLNQGQRGHYPESSLRGIRQSRPELEQYLRPVDDTTWEIDPSLKQSVTFRQFNLKSKSCPFRSTFHLILCRNVFIYFDETGKQTVVDTLREALMPDGHLFTGHTENLNRVDHAMERVQPAIFRKSES